MPQVYRKKCSRVVAASPAQTRKVLGEHRVLRAMRIVPNGENDADYPRYLALEELVIEACTEAQNYEAAVDDAKAVRRRADTEFLSNLPGHRRDVRKVANFIRRYAGRLRPAIKQMHRVKGIRILFEQRTSLGAAWSDLLSAYEQALEPQHLPAKKGPFAHRFQHGALDFGQAIDERSGTFVRAAETSLLFQLALYFKQYTSGASVGELGYVQTGEPMPSFGDPCWSICGDVLAAVFGDHIPAPDDLRRRLSKLLTKYPALSFVGWPTPVCRN